MDKNLRCERRTTTTSVAKGLDQLNLRSKTLTNILTRRNFFFEQVLRGRCCPERKEPSRALTTVVSSYEKGVTLRSNDILRAVMMCRTLTGRRGGLLRIHEVIKFFSILRKQAAKAVEATVSSVYATASAILAIIW